jgi:hypothetical protein
VPAPGSHVAFPRLGQRETAVRAVRTIAAAISAAVEDVATPVFTCDDAGCAAVAAWAFQRRIPEKVVSVLPSAVAQ